MVSTTDARQAAAQFAERYTGEDPHGNAAEQLISDETFGQLSVARDELRILQRYGEDISEGLALPIDEAIQHLDVALARRADEVLTQEVEP